MRGIVLLWATGEAFGGRSIAVPYTTDGPPIVIRCGNTPHTICMQGSNLLSPRSLPPFPRPDSGLERSRPKRPGAANSATSGPAARTRSKASLRSLVPPSALQQGVHQAPAPFGKSNNVPLQPLSRAAACSGRGRERSHNVQAPVAPGKSPHPPQITYPRLRPRLYAIRTHCYYRRHFFPTSIPSLTHVLALILRGIA